MDIHSIRQELRTKKIFDIPLRVTYYARVSTDSDEQLNSLDNQMSYYQNFIKSKPAWTFVPGYIDEGISGASTKKRGYFNNMIEDGLKGKFDLIITKEISRFARNTLDSIRYTRDLLSAGVAVLFENDSINTIDEDSEFRLAIMSSVAQDELRKLSTRVKFGHQQAIKSGVVLGNSRIFGYRKDHGRLVIDEDEAIMVVELFTLYATGQYSMKQIENIFWDKGYRNHKGNKIAHTTMSNMISNPKYKGYYVGNKVKVVDLFSKKQKFLPPEEWVIFKDETGEIVPAIVSEELWEQANAVLIKRSEDVKNRKGICNHANLLTGKLFCSHCGSAYYRRDAKDRAGNKKSRWVCSAKINNGADSCPSFTIYEEDIKPILFDVFAETKMNIDDLIEEYIRMYSEINQGEDIEKRIAQLEGMIEMCNKKKSKLLGYNVSGQISDKEFLAMSEECNSEILSAEAELAELTDRKNASNELSAHISQIRETLKIAQRDASQGLISKEFVDRYIDRIIATPLDNNTMQLSIKIFTGELTEKYLENLRSRTGHTLKKMIEKYENDIKNTAK